MRAPFKILLFVLPILLIGAIIALSRWEIPAPSTEVTKSISTDKFFTRSK